MRMTAAPGLPTGRPLVEAGRAAGRQRRLISIAACAFLFLSPAAAADFQVSQAYSGSPAQFPVSLQAGDGIAITLSAQMAAGGLDFALLDPDGVEIAGSHDSNITNGQTGLAEKTVWTSGTYVVEVTGPPGAAGSPLPLAPSI